MMHVLVDSCVWSLALRRRAPATGPTQTLRNLIRDGKVAMIGPIRQEILSGIAVHDHFVQVKTVLAAFPDLPLTSEDFATAAECFNQCRQRGLQGSHTNLLLCAVAKRHRLAICSTDGDFAHYAKVLRVSLYQVAG
jgi:predicted nucleic acid-binding protein